LNQRVAFNKVYNREITHAPVALFLGAAASKPFGKMLMAEFINSLYADKTFTSSPLFKQIAQKNSDLEYLFEQLEDWADGLCTSAAKGNISFCLGLSQRGRRPKKNATS